MVEWHYKSNRKPSGGILNTAKRADKKLAQKGGIFSSTTIAKTEKEVRVDNHRRMGGSVRQKAKSILFANIVEGSKIVKGKVLAVVENAANRLYTRRNIITKGALIKVELAGSEKVARVTSRPGQDGVVNAVLTEAPKSKKTEKAEKKAKAAQKMQKAETDLAQEKASQKQKSAEEKHEKAVKHSKPNK